WNYDSTGKLQTVVDANGLIVTYAYDAGSGRLVGVTDPNNTAVKFVYDGTGHLSSINRGTVSGGVFTPYATTGEGYDAATNSLLTQVTDSEGNLRKFVYDGSAKLKQDLYGGREYDFTYNDGAVSTVNQGLLALSTVVPQLFNGIANGSTGVLATTLQF